MSGELDAAASRLRAAIEEGAYAGALALLPQFRRELDAALAKAPTGGAAAMALVSSARDLLEWSRRTALCGHAHIAAQLEALACLGAYQTSRRERSWTLDG